MKSDDSEIKRNFDKFTEGWKKSLPEVIEALDPSSAEFEGSYRRLTSLNAWRAGVLQNNISDGSLAFYAESMNDALSSHVFARMGAWRAALKALRSCVENVCYCLYYADHPVELRLWELGKHRLSFTELITYFESHPQILEFKDNQLAGLNFIRAEFSTLSRAVHGSAKSFRMIQEDLTYALWKPDVKNLNQWIAREKSVVQGINLLLTALFRDNLSGTKNSGIRKSLKHSISSNAKSKLKANWDISI